MRRDTPHVTVEPDMVAGCTHVGVGFHGAREVIRLVHPQQIHPHLEGQDTGDSIHIHGVPEVHMAIRPEIAGGLSTAGIAVNAIPHVVAARVIEGLETTGYGSNCRWSHLVHDDLAHSSRG